MNKKEYWKFSGSWLEIEISNKIKTNLKIESIGNIWNEIVDKYSDLEIYLPNDGFAYPLFDSFDQFLVFKLRCL